MTINNTEVSQLNEHLLNTCATHALQASVSAPILATTDTGGKLGVELAGLIGQHTLIQAMSGGGKGFALRRLIELCLSTGIPAHISMSRTSSAR